MIDDDLFKPPKPPYPDKKVYVAFEMVSPELAEWFSNLDIYDRELIIMDAYMDSKIGKIRGSQCPVCKGGWESRIDNYNDLCEKHFSELEARIRRND